MAEKLLGKYDVDWFGRLYVEAEQRRYYPVDFNEGRMVVMTSSLVWDREQRRNFEPSEFPAKIPLGRPHFDR